MFDRILLKSGQFVLAKSKVEIDIDSFRILVEDALAVYSKLNPYHQTITKQIISPRQTIFSENNPFSSDLIVPDWISEVTPIKFAGLSLSAFNMQQYAARSSELIDPIQAPWDYSKPVLTVAFSSSYKITGVFKHRITRVAGSDDMAVSDSFEVKTITYEDNIFFDLLQGLFLQGIGRSRRAFTLNDLPITMDADAIASEGKDIFESAKETLAQQSKFYLSMG